MDVRRILAAVACAAAVAAPLATTAPASATRKDERPTITLKGVKLNSGKVVVNGTYKCATSDVPVKYIELVASQWQEAIDDEVRAIAATGELTGRTLPCTGTDRKFQKSVTAKHGKFVKGPVGLEVEMWTGKDLAVTSGDYTL